ncbi:hypothetical protein [Nonomuraea sp. NPDC049309]|uniref:hypothetical protein n=1 Tax=Nonomuraea sp. NPDC049309 TaxID=3364350 RepID=UPI0037138B4A
MRSAGHQGSPAALPYRRDREKELAETHAKRAAELAVKTVKALTGHWSEPDTARLMGLSKQRVHQLKVSAWPSAGR